MLCWVAEPLWGNSCMAVAILICSNFPMHITHTHTHTQKPLSKSHFETGTLLEQLKQGKHKTLGLHSKHLEK